jgi:hypothetical protein
MMFKKLTILAVLLSLFVLPTSVAADSHNPAQVYVIHGVPGKDVSPDLDPALPVDVSVDGACVLEGFEFEDVAGPLPLPAGSYEIAISLADEDDPCSGPVAIGPATVPFEAGENATVIAHLTEDGTPTASKFVNDLSEIRRKKARVAVRHTAAAPTVDIKLRRIYHPRKQLLIKDLSNPNEAQAEIRAGKWMASIRPAGSRKPVFGPIEVEFDRQTAYFIYAVGSLKNETFTLITQELAPPVDATVYVIHGIPGKDVSPDLDPALPVDVSVDGACVLEGFEFKDIAGPLSLPPGSYEIAISLADEDDPCSGPVAIGPATVPFESGENATVIAHLTEDGTPTASKFVNDLSPADWWKARVAVRHTAAAPTVDIELQCKYYDSDRLFIEGLSNSEEAQADVWIGRWKATIFPTGDDTAVFGPAELKLRRNRSYSVYAVGSLENETFDLIVHPIRIPRHR